MSNLKLITTESFGDLSCNFYRNMNDDILLTREQIGQALEYSDPSMCIRRIHLKHKDRLDQLCVRIKLGEYQNGTNLTKSEEQERVYYTERGIMEICRWSRQPKANQFMDWVWDIIEKYRHNDLIDSSVLTSILTSINQSLTTIAASLSTITTTMTSMQEEINTLKQPKYIPQRTYSGWFTKMRPKYEALEKYFNISRKELLRNLYLELQNLYPDIDLAQIQSDYCYENNISSCFTSDVIEHNKELRTLYEHMVNTFLEEYNLTQDIPVIKYKTIFTQ